MNQEKYSKMQTGKKIKQIFLVALCMAGLWLSGTHEAIGREPVRIATIGTRPPTLDKSMGYQKMVEGMIRFWKRELQQVIHSKPDLIVLPENCDFPWGLKPDEKEAYIKVRGNQILDYFASVARSTGSYFVFGMRRYDENGDSRNSGMLLDRQGKLIGIYNKNYPTIKEMETGVKPATEVPVFETDFGRVAIAICYDLNFDELQKRYAALKPNLIVFPSAYHGGYVQSDWAYKCRSYFVGAISGRGAPSQIRNPLGDVVASSTNYYDYAIADVNLDYAVAHLDYNRARMQNMIRKYQDAVQVYDPGEVGAVLITSAHETVRAEQMAREFEVELLDDYFKRAEKVKAAHE